MSQPNYLNNAFSPQQAKAIEKYVASFVADVLKSYEAGVVEAPKPVVAPKKSKQDAPVEDLLG